MSFFKYNQVFYVSFIAIAVIFVTLPSMKLDPKNPPTGQTGAPNETTCSTASGCHSGGNYSGSVALSGLPDQILPTTSYNITVTLNSTCIRTGFELTVLDKANTKCGTLVAGTNNNVKTINGRQYIRQTNANTMSGGSSSYAFKWTSPASISGDSAIFYYVMLQANGNGNTSGDNVAKGKKTVGLPAPSSTQESELAKLVKIFPNPCSDYLQLVMPDSEKFQVQLTSSSGQNIMQFEVNGNKTLDIKNLSAGTYILNFKGVKSNLIRKIEIIH